MRLLLIAVLSFSIVGCTTVQVPDYIKSDHPYTRTFYGDYEKIIVSIKDVLGKNGWRIAKEMHPSVYERAADETKESYKDLLIFTEVKQHTMILYSSYTHLNVFLHVVAGGADAEIRYGKQTPLLFKTFLSTRNDALVQKIFRQIEQKILESN